MTHEERLLEAVASLEGLVPTCAPLTIEQVDHRELNAPDFGTSAKWAVAAGAYVFFDGPSARYIGRALKGQGLRKRLSEHRRAPTDSAIRALISSPASSVRIVALPDGLEWLAPSLELFLHWQLREHADLINKKRS
jgi:hypothetical protein